MIAIIIPSYRVKDHILKVLEDIGPEVDRIYVVDDACPQKTGEHVRKHCTDRRVTVLTHETNQGVGGATLTGFRQAAQDGAKILVKLDGDGQMNPQRIPRLVRPLKEGLCDYAKGNRFFSLQHISGMPKVRLMGNSALSFITKISSGYWRLMDPTNGFIALHAGLLPYLPVNKIDTGYFFESDMLFRLNVLRAVILDVPMKAQYGKEQSGLRVARILIPFAFKHLRCFFKRIVYTYFLRDFNIASAQFLAGVPLFLGGMSFGITQWLTNSAIGKETPVGTVMVAVLPVLLGFQMLLSAINYDILNEPRFPLQRYL